jgi:hypothetical protein
MHVSHILAGSSNGGTADGQQGRPSTPGRTSSSGAALAPPGVTFPEYFDTYQVGVLDMPQFAACMRMERHSKFGVLAEFHPVRREVRQCSAWRVIFPSIGNRPYSTALYNIVGTPLGLLVQEWREFSFSMRGQAKNVLKAAALAAPEPVGCSLLPCALCMFKRCTNSCHVIGYAQRSSWHAPLSVVVIAAALCCS